MWDRWVIIAAALMIAVRTARWGWQLGRGGDWRAGAGGFVLALIALGVPLLLALRGPSSGR